MLCERVPRQVDGEDEFDYVEHFAGLLPPTVILSLVGYPEGHAKEFKELTDQSLHVDEGRPHARPGRTPDRQRER